MVLITWSLPGFVGHFCSTRRCWSAYKWQTGGHGVGRCCCSMLSFTAAEGESCTSEVHVGTSLCRIFVHFCTVVDLSIFHFCRSCQYMIFYLFLHLFNLFAVFILVHVSCRRVHLVVIVHFSGQFSGNGMQSIFSSILLYTLVQIFWSAVGTWRTWQWVHGTVGERCLLPDLPGRSLYISVNESNEWSVDNVSNGVQDVCFCCWFLFLYLLSPQS